MGVKRLLLFLLWGVAGRDKEVLLSQTFIKDFSQQHIET
jgi:hypothetical protein